CILTLGKLEPAASTAEHDADATTLFQAEGFSVQLRIFESLTRRYNRKRRRARNVLALFELEIFERIDPAHLTGNLNRKWRWIECRDALDPARGISKSVPEFFARIANGSQAADS